MTEREALLRAVCEDPDDDTPRLVFADWLDENGEPARAEFIRVQVQFAALHRAGVVTTPARAPFAPGGPAAGPDPQVLRKRDREIWGEYKKRFRAELPQIDGVVWFEEFYRGFVERVTVSSDALLVRYADAILNRVPVQHLEIGRFDAVGGFAALPGLRRLKTLRLVNHLTDAAVVRRLVAGNFNDSVLVFAHFGQLTPALRAELRRAFGDRVWIPK